MSDFKDFPAGEYVDPEATGERLEPEDGDERKVGTIGDVVVVSTPIRRTRTLARDAVSGHMDPVEDGPRNPADRLLVPRRYAEELVVARDMQEVLRKANE